MRRLARNRQRLPRRLNMRLRTRVCIHINIRRLGRSDMVRRRLDCVRVDFVVFVRDHHLMWPGAAGLIIVIVGRAVATHKSLQILLVNMAVRAATSPGDVGRATICLPVVHRRLHHLL